MYITYLNINFERNRSFQILSHIIRQLFTEYMEVSTTNLEKNIEGLSPATNISIQVRAYNDQGCGPPSNPVFCSTLDGGKAKGIDDT